MNQALKDQVAIITGGAQGIGRAIGETLARDGATVIVADLNMEAAMATARAINDTWARAVAAQVDVSDEASVKALYAQVLGVAKRVDILVNNAGICRMIPILDIEVEEWDRIMAVNLRGTFLMSREAFRLRKGGREGGHLPLTTGSTTFRLA